MNSEWKPFPLGECVTFLSGNTPSKSNPDYWGPGTPWISAKDMKSFWVEKAQDTLTPDGAKKASRIMPSGTTLLLTRGMTLHNDVPIVRTRHPAAFNQDIKAVIPKPAILDDFVPYLLLGNKPRLQDMVDSAGHGTGRLNSDSLKALEVLLPPLKDQRELAAFFSGIDERISLLIESNTTLDAIRQTLFRSWFVDFNPVRAKMEGRNPDGLDPTTAALFPSEFEKSELGPIPHGWRVVDVADVAKVTKGKSYSSKDLVANHHTALVTLKSFERGGGFRLDGFKPYSGTFKEEQVVNPGDLIVAYTDVTQAAELIGKPATVIGVDEFSTLVASLDVGIIRPTVKTLSRQFLYGLFCTDSFQAHTYSHTSGTTVLHLSKNAIETYKFSLPPSSIIAAYSEIAGNFSTKIQVNTDLIRTLSQIRERLLPRLISGELRMPEARGRLQEHLS